MFMQRTAKLMAWYFAVKFLSSLISRFKLKESGVYDASGQDIIERASEESFPASDSPGWIYGVASHERSPAT